jgi:hypothetical protein
MSQSNHTVADIENIEKYRHDLFDVEIFLRHLIRDDLYSLEQTELMLLAQTLAKQAEEKLHDVCGWLEDMQIEAEKREASKLTVEQSGGAHE